MLKAVLLASRDVRSAVSRGLRMAPCTTSPPPTDPDGAETTSKNVQFWVSGQARAGDAGSHAGRSGAGREARIETGGYSPTVAAALARKSEPSRMYLRATATLVWRVWRMMSRSSAPAMAADVARPARRLWPA